MAIRKKNQSNILDNRVLGYLFNSKVLPFTLSFVTLTILFVAFRMKGIDQAYQLNTQNTWIEKSVILNKELKAQRAKLLSVQKLRSIANANGLKEPSSEQIILIP